jgi:hypothetical protein
MIDIEIWKDVPGYEGIYKVSDLGNVISLITTRRGIKKEPKLLKQSLSSGYYKVVLCGIKSNVNYKVHQIVAMAFLGHIPFGYDRVVNHKDFNKLNNNLENLEIISQRENSSKKHLKSTSKFVGVCWCKINNKWKSSISFKGKNKSLGLFKDEKEASLFYNNALTSIATGKNIVIKEAIYSSQYKGVSYRKQYDNWKAYIIVNKKVVHLGYYKTENEAYESVKKANQ